MKGIRTQLFAKAAQVAIALAVLAVAQAARAVSPGQDITMSPTSLKYDLNAGASVSGSLTIINDGTQAYDFTLYATPYNVSGEDYNQSFQLKGSQTDVSKWVTVTQVPYHLASGQHVDVPYKITVPSGTGPGGYYAVLFAETVPNSQPSGSGLVIRKRVGAVLYLQVNGAVDERGQVVSFVSNFWQTSPPLQTTLRLGNEGNVHYQADIQVSIADLFGRTKARFETSHIVLPQTIRRVELDWRGAPAFGLFKVFGTVNMLNRIETLPTRYVLIMSEKFFWIFLAVLLAMAIICAGLVLGQRKARRDAEKERRQAPPANPPRPPSKPPRRV